jgi:hypothetical protein
MGAQNLERATTHMCILVYLECVYGTLGLPLKQYGDPEGSWL